MNCESVKSNLIAYLDGRAPQEESKGTESHLAACEACRARAEEFGAVWGLLDELPAVVPSVGFDARLRARMATEPRRRLWLVPQPRFVLSLAALLVMAIWVSMRPPVAVQNRAAVTPAEEDFHVVKDLPVLENYDVLANFEALSALPAAPSPSTTDQPQERE